MGLSFKRKRMQLPVSQAGEGASSKAKYSARTLQKGWANWMSKRTSNFKRRHWLIALALFILVAGGYNCYLIIDSILSKGRVIFSIYPIHRLLFFSETGEAASDPVFQLPPGEYERIHRFRLHIDSLAASPSGKKVHDSILLYRPGLMDSVLFIEEYYKRPNSDKPLNKPLKTD